MDASAFTQFVADKFASFNQAVSDATTCAVDCSKSPLVITNNFYVTESAPSITWLYVVVITIALSTLIFFKLNLPRASNKVLASIGILNSLGSLYPFYIYLNTGFAWTGLTLNEIQTKMIEHRHVVIMGLWSILSTIQLLTMFFPIRFIHRQVGKFTFNFLVPLMFIELLCNAAFVFVPQKPMLLAKALTGEHDPSIMSVMTYTLPFAAGLLTPVAMLIYYLLAAKTATSNIRLHKTYAVLLVVAANGPGWMRYATRWGFHTSNCPMFQDDQTSALVQASGFDMMGFFYVPLIALIYTTFSMKDRQNDRYIRWSFYFYIFHHTFSQIAACALNVPFSVACHSLEATSTQEQE